MRPSVGQLFGLHRNGRGDAPSAQGRACKPQGGTGCAAVPETNRAVDLWTMACRPPGRLPWKSLTTFPPRSPSPTSSTAHQSFFIDPPSPSTYKGEGADRRHSSRAPSGCRSCCPRTASPPPFRTCHPDTHAPHLLPLKGEAGRGMGSGGETNSGMPDIKPKAFAPQNILKIEGQVAGLHLTYGKGSAGIRGFPQKSNGVFFQKTGIEIAVF